MKEKVVDLKYAKLHLIKTNKFRSINFKVLLKEEIKKEDITKRNLLTDFLVLSTKKYKTRKELALKIQDLYSLYLSSFNTRIGNYLVTRFNLSILNPKYTENSMLEESLELLHEVLFEPNVKNKEFDKEIFKVVKNDLEKEIISSCENPRVYANLAMLSHLGNGAYSYKGYGYLEDLEKITEKNLYEYYKEFLYKSCVDIYVIGEFDEKEMISLIKEKIDFKTIKKSKGELIIYHDKIKMRPSVFIEDSNFNQSKLSIGCKLKDLTEFERKYVINMYNMILGGGFNSKFMQEIREKNSLAYYINSNVNKADNLLIISSGISKENFDKVISRVKMIMKSIRDGKITDEELEQAKTEYLSILEETYDNIDSIVENEIARDLLNLDNLEVRQEEIKKVTIEDIINVSKKVHLDTIYLLKGDNNGA